MPFFGLFKSKRTSQPVAKSSADFKGSLDHPSWKLKSDEWDAVPPSYGSGAGTHSKTRLDPPPDYSKYELNDKDLAKLSLYDTIFVVDDSTSMRSQMSAGRTRWEEAGEALAEFAALAANFDNDGIDIHFFNSPKANIGVRGQESIEALFHEVSPKGGTFIGKKLRELAEPYITQLKYVATRRTAWPKPRNYIIITDGKARDEENLRGFIKSTSLTLNGLKCPPGQLGFQFVQIGNNAGATQFLEDLDGDKTLLPQDIVDTVKANRPGESFSSDFPKKVLLGGINRYYDRQALELQRKK